MEVDVAIVVAGVVAFAALAQTVTGFGFSLLAVPPLGLVLEPADAIAVALVLLVVANLLLVAAEGAEVDRTATAWLLTGSVVGLPVGLLALRAASADALRLAVAIAVLVTVIIVVTGRPAVGRGRGTLLAAGVLTGALTTSLTTNGPPTALALQGRGLEPEAFRPTVGVVLGVSSAVGVVLFALEGRLGGEVPAALVAGAPAQVIGWAIGLKVRGRVPAAWFRRMILVLLATGAIVSAVAAIR